MQGNGHLNNGKIDLPYRQISQSVAINEDEDSIPGDAPDEAGNIPFLNFVMDGRIWELIKYTIDGLPANCNSNDPSKEIAYFAVQRRRKTRRLDHICELAVLNKGDLVPSGFEVISTPISSEALADDTVVPLKRLAVKRSPNDRSALSHGYAFVDDICVVNLSEGESAPDEFRTIDTLIGGQFRGSTGDRVLLSYHHRQALGICNIPFESASLDRFPRTDHDGLELPVAELPVFVFPHDLKLEYNPRFNFPVPDFFTFVFTDAQGRHLYTACLRFYELISKAEIASVAEAMYGPDLGKVQWADDMEFFCPKVICVVSQYPFYRAMGRYLKQLYSLSLSPSQCPLEHFISSVVAQVPIPVEGGRPFHVVLDAALISQSSRAMPPVCFDLPTRIFFPPMDLDFAGPMRCLSVDNMLAVFCLLLQESKIIFLCSSNALLTEVMETFRSLMFPLLWTSCFITRLPDSLSGVLQAPGGFMIGLHMAAKGDSETATGDTDERLGSKNYSVDHSWVQSLQSGTYITDLTNNKLYLFSSGKTEELNSGRVNQILRQLPTGPYRKLHARILSIGGKYRICPQKFEGMGLVQFDSAFDCVSMDELSLPTGRKWIDFPSLAVRDAFLVFMCDALSDFSRYIRPPEEITAANNFGKSFDELFFVEEYIRDADRSVKGLLRGLMDTQMFPYLIQQRMEECYFPLVFFDEAVKVLRELGLSALGNDRRSTYHNKAGKPNSTAFESDTEIPLYEHVGRISDKNNIFTLPTKPTLITADDSFLKRRSDDTRTEIQPSFASSDTGSKSNGYISVREELSADLDHHLNDRSRGYLIVPGPCRQVQEIEFDEELDEDERPSFIKFRYETGWPTLDSGRLDAVAGDLENKGLRALKGTRARMVGGVDKRCAMFIRAPNCQLGYHSSQSLLRSIPKKMTAESKGSVATVMDIYALSTLLLSARATSGVYPVGTVLQLFSIICHLDEANLLQFVDEPCWRAMMVACGSVNAHNFGHKATCVMYETMRGSGKPTDALAYVQYCRSFSRKVRSGPETTTSFLDPFCYLEQLGLSWFAQKSLATDDGGSGRQDSFNIFPTASGQLTPVKGLSSSHMTPPSDVSQNSHSPGTPKSGSNIWRMFKGGKKDVSVAETGIVMEEMANKALLAYQDVAKALHLERPQAGYALRAPTDIAVGLITKHVEPTIIPELFQLSDTNVETWTNELSQFAARAREDRASVKVGLVQATDVGDDHAPHKGQLTVYAIALHGLSSTNASGDEIMTKNIYTRVWLSTDRGVRLKTEPGIRHANDKHEPESWSRNTQNSLTFYLDEVQDSDLHVEVFGDFQRKQEDACYAFDQSLGSGEVKLQPNESKWIKLGGINTTGNLELYVSILFEKSVNKEDLKTAVKSTERVHDAVETDSSRTSVGATSRTWRDRFSNVFSRTMASAARQSITPPPLERDDFGSENTAVHDETTTSVSVVDTVTEIAAEKHVVEGPDKTVVKTIENFLDAEAVQAVPLATFDGASEKKSRRWRKSLAMLTGEDISELDTNDDDNAVENEKTFSRIRRRLSGNTDDSFHSSEPTEERGSSHAEATPSPTKESGMRNALRRLSGGGAESDQDKPKRIYLGGVLRRMGKQSAATTDPLCVDNRCDAETVGDDEVDVAVDDCVDNNKLREDVRKVSDGLEASKETESLPVDAERGKYPICEDEAGVDHSLRRPDSVDSQSGRSVVDVHPLCFDIDGPNVYDVESEHGAGQDKAIVPTDPAFATDLDAVALHIDTSAAQPDEPASKEYSDGRAGSIATQVSTVQSGVTADDCSDNYMGLYLDHIKSVEAELSVDMTVERVVWGIYSESPCPSCGHLLFDDEVMASWGGFCANSRGKDGDIIRAHVILCPSCKADIVPTLHIRKYKLSELLDVLSVEFEVNVPHLSPYGLRYMVEQVMVNHGFTISNASWLLQTHPVVYWNWMWYCARFNVPSGLFFDCNQLGDISLTTSSSPWLGPVLTSWREYTLRVKAKKIISSGGIQDALELTDVFDELSEKDCERIHLIMNNIADGMEGVAKLLMRLSQIKPLLNQFGGTQGRKIYMVVLIMVHLFKPHSLVQASVDLPQELSKGVVFDRILMEVTSIAIKPSDFEKMSTNDMELIDASSGRAAQALRIAFGLLL